MTLSSVLSRYFVCGCVDIDHLVDPIVDGRIILKRIFRKWDVGAWTGLIWNRIGTGGGNL